MPRRRAGARIVRAPVAISTGLSVGRVPQIRAMGNCTRVSHSEEFAPVTTTGTPFAVATFQCNPGVAACFPWLAPIAARYEMYKFRRLVFKFTTTAPTSTAGFVTLAFDYDALDLPPSTMSIARSYHDKSGGAPWSNWVLNCDLAQGDRLPEKYIRVGLPPTNNDLKTYDVGNLHVCTEGISAATVGYLEVEYVVDLMTPQIQDPVGGSQSFTSDVTHIFKNVNVTDNDAVFPFTTSGGQTMLFYQNWEGLIVLNLTGTVASSLSCAATGTVGSAVTICLGALANSAATTVQVSYSVRALPGTILTWSPTATTVTAAQLVWATAAYAGLDFTVSSSSSSSYTTLSSPSVASTTVWASSTSSSQSSNEHVPEGLVSKYEALSQSTIDQVVALTKAKKH
jgi:hypothetical protein